ncbi:MAG TPA: LPS-assembly protein LptD, partial [Allosphingosinicella sp.]
LRDREEIRLGGRVRFANHWSLFGSTVVDLTSNREDPFTSADGYEPVRHRLGLAYDDECIEIGITWRRDYETTGDFQRGNSFLFRVGLKNLGR